MQLHTTPVPNVVFDHYLKELKVAELKVLMVIIRQTSGWSDMQTKSKRKEKDWISGSQLALKTGCSKRAINSAIEELVQKNLINVLSESGAFLDTPEKRRGQQKLFYSLSPAVGSPVENLGKGGLYLCFSQMANANIAEGLRKKLQELTQKMHITKETLQN
jgi:DNA-binding transcriptional regulator YhcF (GntR family)